MNAKEHRSAGCYNPQMFATLSRKRNMIYQAVHNMWPAYKSACTLGIFTPFVFSYITGKVQTGTEMERNLTQKMSKVKYEITSLDAFLRCVRYGPTECLASLWMVSGCKKAGALLYVSPGSTRLSNALDISRPVSSLVVDSASAFCRRRAFDRN